MDMKNSLHCLLIFGLVLALGCSGKKEEARVAQEESLPAASEQAVGAFNPDESSHKLEPVALSPEDRKKAGQAPDGMAFIKGGCFSMGNNLSQTDEKPEHEVCVDDFYMDKYEVTQARWLKVIGVNPAKFMGDNNPVEQVNYNDIQEFIQKTGGDCRLPTEAEWEYAFAAGTPLNYYWGNIMDGEYAWFKGNSGDTSHPVGQKLPNQFGLYDMAGNVWEWVEDWYETPYSVEEQNNSPKGPLQGQFKVIRGGAFDSSPGALRTTNRTWLHPANRVFSKVTTHAGAVNEIYNYIGFRCAKSMQKTGVAPETKPAKS